MNTAVSLTDLRSGQVARVAGIRGGWGVQRRLQALGVRPGATVKKVSAALRPGAVVVEVCGCQVALGFGVARRILVDVLP